MPKSKSKAKGKKSRGGPLAWAYRLHKKIMPLSTHHRKCFPAQDGPLRSCAPLKGVCTHRKWILKRRSRGRHLEAKKPWCYLLKSHGGKKKRKKSQKKKSKGGKRKKI